MPELDVKAALDQALADYFAVSNGLIRLWNLNIDICTAAVKAHVALVEEALDIFEC